MSYEVETRTVSVQLLAAVRRHIFIRDIGRTWKPALDLVWEFLRRHEGLRTGGHNCFLYHHPAHRNDPMAIDFGVQVVRTFTDEGEVICTQTPAGEVVATTHVGGYDQLGGAHDAIHSWAAANGREFAGYSWEIYGDWNDDPSKLETEVVYLLK